MQDEKKIFIIFFCDIEKIFLKKMLKLLVTLWLTCQICITSCNQQNKYLKILKSSENLNLTVPLNTGNNKNANVLLNSTRFQRIERDLKSQTKNLFCTSNSDTECGVWENCQKIYETFFETVECSFLTNSVCSFFFLFQFFLIDFPLNN